MSKIIKRLFITALVILGLAAVMPNIANAQGVTTEEFCANVAPLLLSELPAENPCEQGGQFIALSWWDTNRAGDTFGRKVFTDYEQMYELAKTYLSAKGDGSVWFEPGEAVATTPEATEVTTKTLGAKTAGLKQIAVLKTEETRPYAWTENVCNGGGAFVLQEAEEGGDGVTGKTSDELGCATDSPMLFVEPWGPTVMNPDSACYVSSWAEIDKFAQRMGWKRGSVWRVDASYKDNPLVVDCAAVNGPEDMGLNRYENQVRMSRITWIMERATTLLKNADMTLEQYCNSFPNDPLSTQFVCAEYAK